MKIRFCFSLLAAAVAFLVSAALWQTSTLSSTESFNARSKDKPKVLYVTHSAGFKHPVLPFSETMFKEIGERNGFELTATQDCSVISAQGLAPYKAVVFYTALGHREEVWKDERFQQHLVGGLRWAARF